MGLTGFYGGHASVYLGLSLSACPLDTCLNRWPPYAGCAVMASELCSYNWDTALHRSSVCYPNSCYLYGADTPQNHPLIYMSTSNHIKLIHEYCPYYQVWAMSFHSKEQNRTRTLITVSNVHIHIVRMQHNSVEIWWDYDNQHRFKISKPTYNAWVDNTVVHVGTHGHIAQEIDFGHYCPKNPPFFRGLWILICNQRPPNYDKVMEWMCANRTCTRRIAINHGFESIFEFEWYYNCFRVRPQILRTTGQSPAFVEVQLCNRTIAILKTYQGIGSITLSRAEITISTSNVQWLFLSDDIYECDESSYYWKIDEFCAFGRVSVEGCPLVTNGPWNGTSEPHSPISDLLYLDYEEAIDEGNLTSRIVVNISKTCCETPYTNGFYSTKPSHIMLFIASFFLLEKVPSVYTISGIALGEMCTCFLSEKIYDPLSFWNCSILDFGSNYKNIAVFTSTDLGSAKGADEVNVTISEDHYLIIRLLILLIYFATSVTLCFFISRVVKNTKTSWGITAVVVILGILMLTTTVIGDMNEECSGVQWSRTRHRCTGHVWRSVSHFDIEPIKRVHCFLNQDCLLSELQSNGIKYQLSEYRTLYLNSIFNFSNITQCNCSDLINTDELMYYNSLSKIYSGLCDSMLNNLTGTSCTRILSSNTTSITWESVGPGWRWNDTNGTSFCGLSPCNQLKILPSRRNITLKVTQESQVINTLGNIVSGDFSNVDKRDGDIRVLQKLYMILSHNYLVDVKNPRGNVKCKNSGTVIPMDEVKLTKESQCNGPVYGMWKNGTIIEIGNHWNGHTTWNGFITNKEWQRRCSELMSSDLSQLSISDVLSSSDKVLPTYEPGKCVSTYKLCSVACEEDCSIIMRAIYTKLSDKCLAAARLAFECLPSIREIARYWTIQHINKREQCDRAIDEITDDEIAAKELSACEQGWKYHIALSSKMSTFNDRIESNYNLYHSLKQMTTKNYEYLYKKSEALSLKLSHYSNAVTDWITIEDDLSLWYIIMKLQWCSTNVSCYSVELMNLSKDLGTACMWIKNMTDDWNLGVYRSSILPAKIRSLIYNWGLPIDVNMHNHDVGEENIAVKCVSVKRSIDSLSIDFDKIKNMVTELNDTVIDLVIKEFLGLNQRVNLNTIKLYDSGYDTAQTLTAYDKRLERIFKLENADSDDIKELKKRVGDVEIVTLNNTNYIKVLSTNQQLITRKQETFGNLIDATRKTLQQHDVSISQIISHQEGLDILVSSIGDRLDTDEDVLNATNTLLYSLRTNVSSNQQSIENNYKQFLADHYVLTHLAVKVNENGELIAKNGKKIEVISNDLIKIGDEIIEINSTVNEQGNSIIKLQDLTQKNQKLLNSIIVPGTNEVYESRASSVSSYARRSPSHGGGGCKSTHASVVNFGNTQCNYQSVNGNGNVVTGSTQSGGGLGTISGNGNELDTGGIVSIIIAAIALVISVVALFLSLCNRGTSTQLVKTITILMIFMPVIMCDLSSPEYERYEHAENHINEIDEISQDETINSLVKTYLNVTIQQPAYVERPWTLNVTSLHDYQNRLESWCVEHKSIMALIIILLASSTLILVTYTIIKACDILTMKEELTKQTKTSVLGDDLLFRTNGIVVTGLNDVKVVWKYLCGRIMISYNESLIMDITFSKSDTKIVRKIGRMLWRTKTFLRILCLLILSCFIIRPVNALSRKNENEDGSNRCNSNDIKDNWWFWCFLFTSILLVTLIASMTINRIYGWWYLTCCFFPGCKCKLSASGRCPNNHHCKSCNSARCTACRFCYKHPDTKDKDVKPPYCGCWFVWLFAGYCTSCCLPGLICRCKIPLTYIVSNGKCVVGSWRYGGMLLRPFAYCCCYKIKDGLQEGYDQESQPDVMTCSYPPSQVDSMMVQNRKHYLNSKYHVTPSHGRIHK